MHRPQRLLAWLALLAFLTLGACAPAAGPGEGMDATGIGASPLAAVTPATTAAVRPSPMPTVAPTLVASSEQEPAAKSLVLLHTNDNWGETEPCG